MLVTIGLFALFLGFVMALALFWWFLTEVLPWLILISILYCSIRIFGRDTKKCDSRDA
jgi:hypothetical protein